MKKILLLLLVVFFLQSNISLAAEKKWVDSITGMEFVWVPKGCFQMGSNSGNSDEKPVHEVCVDGFWIGKYEVTQRQWKKIIRKNPSYFRSGKNFPVEKVSWNDIKKYISKLNEKSGNTFKLPTEAQWEFAARSGGKDQKYAGGNDVDSVAWYYRSKSDNRTHKVGTKASNDLGIYDMSGNVFEWCEDWYGEYTLSSVINPEGPSSGSNRVLRGGSWYVDPPSCRSTLRSDYDPNFRGNDIGFRLLRMP